MSIKKISKFQPELFEFTKENLKKAEKEVEKYPHNKKESAVLGLLYLVQNQNSRCWTIFSIEGQEKFLKLFLPNRRFLKMTKLQMKRHEPQNKFLEHLRVQKVSKKAKLFKNFIFVAIRNFYHQQLLLFWKSRFCNLLPVEIYDGNKNVIFEKFGFFRYFFHLRTLA